MCASGAASTALTTVADYRTASSSRPSTEHRARMAGGPRARRAQNGTYGVEAVVREDLPSGRWKARFTRPDDRRMTATRATKTEADS